jgi:photosynthetic reaction center cytochrome c subunit
MSDQDTSRETRVRKLYRDILVAGGIPGAVLITLALIWLLWPIDSQQEQTGFRGTGMVQFTPEEDANRLASLNVVPESQEPFIPAEGTPLAKDVYQNVQVLGNVDQNNFLRLMTAITEWVSPEQGCDYCHAGAAEGNYADDGLYTKIVSRRMIQMTQNINENWQTHVKDTGVTCYTCHRGQPVPQHIWFEEPRPEAASQLGMNTMSQNRADETVGYASLPGDPLTKFLLEDNEIRVGAEVPRETPIGASIQDTEWTYGLMFHFSYSLGVNCTFCHNSRAWNQWDQSPPTRANAWFAIRMLRDLNQNYLHPLDVYPAKRLGPTGDAPKANCTTCHQGVNKPLYGVSMIDAWPELQTTGTPVYEQPDEAAEAGGTEERADAGTTAPN